MPGLVKWLVPDFPSRSCSPPSGENNTSRWLRDESAAPGIFGYARKTQAEIRWQDYIRADSTKLPKSFVSWVRSCSAKQVVFRRPEGFAGRTLAGLHRRAKQQSDRRLGRRFLAMPDRSATNGLVFTYDPHTGSGGPPRGCYHSHTRGGETGSRDGREFAVDSSV